MFTTDTDWQAHLTSLTSARTALETQIRIAILEEQLARSQYEVWQLRAQLTQALARPTPQPEPTPVAAAPSAVLPTLADRVNLDGMIGDTPPASVVASSVKPVPPHGKPSQVKAARSKFQANAWSFRTDLPTLDLRQANWEDKVAGIRMYTHQYPGIAINKLVKLTKLPVNLVYYIASGGKLYPSDAAAHYPPLPPDTKPTPVTSSAPFERPFAAELGLRIDPATGLVA